MTDVVCDAGPHDRPYEERHSDVCIALVTGGTFEYRTVSGSAMLAPGALLLGNHCDCFECRHEHAVGDRCLAFHYAPGLFADMLASKVNMSVYHFLRCFRSVTGLTPHQYVLRLRLHRAALRLRATRDSIAEIAMDSGFGDLSTFNHRFRRVMGTTPGAYRAACR